MAEIERLTEAFEDPGINELMINPDGSVFVERAGGKLERLAAAPTQADVLAFARAILGAPEEFGPRRTHADLTAADGSRVHVIAPPLARGLTVTVRKRPARRPTLEELVKGGGLTANCAAFLEFAVRRKLNILVAGGTSSGKTTLLSALAAKADPEERVIVVEDTPELSLPQKHALYLKTRLKDSAGHPDVSLRELLVNVLRMRPDRVIVGETRGPEAADMLQAMNFGQDGMLSTVHANSAREAISRLEVLVLQSGLDLPMKALRASIVSALDLIVFMARLADGSRRVLQVAELTGMELETPSMADLFGFDARRGGSAAGAGLKPTGTIPRFYDRLRRDGVEPPLSFFQNA